MKTVVLGTPDKRLETNEVLVTWVVFRVFVLKFVLYGKLRNARC